MSQGDTSNALRALLAQDQVAAFRGDPAGFLRQHGVTLDADETTRLTERLGTMTNAELATKLHASGFHSMW
jgi:hypothetical protein